MHGLSGVIALSELYLKLPLYQQFLEMQLALEHDVLCSYYELKYGMVINRFSDPKHLSRLLNSIGVVN